MRAELRKGERVIKVGAANLQRGIETVGGSLCLTSQRLVFESHQGNLQRGTTEIELSSIIVSVKCWTKFLGFIPLAPNCLAIFTSEETWYHFALVGRDAWAAAIRSQRWKPPEGSLTVRDQLSR